MITMSDNKKLHLIGNAHLDPIWLWRWQEGCGEVLQTFRSALDRLNEYDDFVFTCSSASYYRWVEEIDPDMFEEIVARVKEGRWVPVNGWWVQPDCNMPSVESYARHALYSQLYYYEKFGRICKTAYNVDSFGHNGMLPQMIRQGGMTCYVMMRPGPHENADIPENLFWWESPDGSRVLTYKIHESYGVSGPENLDRRAAVMSERINESGHGMLLMYGVGNHGGGPTRADIEHLRKNLKREGYADMVFSDPDSFFQSLLVAPLDLPVWTDDLQHHASGCYSAASMVKELNRKAENALQSAEKWNTLAASTTKLPADTAKIAEAWKDVCFNQFHDILCGCSIWEAYEDVRESMGHALTIAARTQNNSLLRLARNIDTWVEGASDPIALEVRHLSIPPHLPRPIVVFNPLSFPVTTPVRTYHPSQAVKDSEGNDVLFQNVRSSRSNDTHEDTVFMATVPALGYATYWLWLRSDEELTIKTDIRCGDMYMENAYIRVEFNRRTGAISKLIDKKSGYNYADGNSFALTTVIDDHETDTWAHNVFTFHKIAGTMQLQSIELVERGPVRAVIRIKHVYNNSTLSQDFILGSHQKTLRVKCKAIWQEPFTMLKMPFAMKGHSEVSTYEIPSGYIKRPCNGEEEPGLAWADLTVTCEDGVRRGVSVMSDSKYSYDCPGMELRITLLRNVIFADHYSHRPPADFQFTDEGLHRFEYGIMIHEGEAEESGIVQEALLFNNRPVAIPESYHKGTGEPQVKSFLSISAPNVIATALKFSEDGSGAAILRCYEANGKAVRATILCETLNAAFHVDFDPFQTKTFRIEKDGSVSEVNFLEGIV